MMAKNEHLPYLAKELTIQQNGVSLFCRQFGQGDFSRSPLIVLHGGPGLGQNYLLPYLANLSKLMPVVFYDQRGSGRSSPLDDSLLDKGNPFENYLTDINNIKDALGCKTFSILAHSWGGMLASFYAAHYPENLNALIYLTPVPSSSEDYLNYVSHRNNFIQKYDEHLEAEKNTPLFAAKDPKTILRFYQRYFQAYFSNPKLVEKLNLNMTKEAIIKNFQTYEIFYEYISKNSFDLYPKLLSFKKPTLIIGGELDIIPFHYLEKLHQHLPGSTLVEIEKSSHFPYIDQPVKLFETIAAFLKNHSLTQG